MAADNTEPASDQPYTWVHCVGCGKGLWRRYTDHLEMIVSPRGGQKRTLRVDLEAAPAIKVICEKCGAETVLHD